MGEKTSIQWTAGSDGSPGFTFNPWIGCVEVSEGCAHCYAKKERFVSIQRGRGLELWGGDAARHVTSDAYWKQPLSWNRKAAADGVRRKVFCASLADVFEDRRDLDAHRARLFALIEQTPHLDWLLLTKRPENMVRLAPASWAQAWPANVWAGCTVENQRRADERTRHLRLVPAHVRFLSCEPLLEALDLSDLLVGQGSRKNDGCICGPEDWGPCEVCDAEGPPRQIDWIIIGGESGPKARPFDLAWARSLIQQGRDAGAAVFVKQLGARPFVARAPLPGSSSARYELPLRDGHGGDPTEWPEDLRMREFPAGGAS